MDVAQEFPYEWALQVFKMLVVFILDSHFESQGKQRPYVIDGPVVNSTIKYDLLMKMFIRLILIFAFLKRST